MDLPSFESAFEEIRIKSRAIIVLILMDWETGKKKRALTDAERKAIMDFVDYKLAM